MRDAGRSVFSGAQPLFESHIVRAVDGHEEPVAGETLDAFVCGHDAHASAVRVDNVDVAASVGAVAGTVVEVVSVLGPALNNRERVQDVHARSSHPSLPEHHGPFVIHHGRIEILGGYRIEGIGTDQLRFHPRVEG